MGRRAFLVLGQQRSGIQTCGTRSVAADAGSAAAERVFGARSLASSPPQRELRIITAAYPVATGVKPQPIGIRRTYRSYLYTRVSTYTRACGCLLSLSVLPLLPLSLSLRDEGAAQPPRTRTSRTRTYTTRGRVKTARDVTGTRFSRLDRPSRAANACLKTIARVRQSRVNQERAEHEPPCIPRGKIGSRFVQI